MNFSPQQPITVAEEKSRMVKEKKEAHDKIKEQDETILSQSETITKLTTEVEETKSPDTAIALYQKKY